MMIAAVYIHPVTSLTIPILFTILALISKQKKFLYITSILISTWLICNIIMTYYIYPQENIDVNNFFDIYISIRHPHHYLPSAYIYSLLPILYNFIMVLIPVAIYSIINKSVFLVRFLVITFSIPIIITIIQYIGVELLKIKPFIMLGISRLYPIYQILFICLEITILVLLFDFIYEHFCNIKIKHFLNNLSLRISNIYKYYIKYPVYCLVIIFYIIFIPFVTYNIYHNIWNIFDVSLEKNISYKLKSMATQYSSILDQSSLEYFREIGMLPVYFDNVFPMATTFIVEWNKRRKKVLKFTACLENTNSLSTCNKYIDDTIILITKNSYIDSSPLFSIEKNNIRYFAYYIFNNKLKELNYEF